MTTTDRDRLTFIDLRDRLDYLARQLRPSLCSWVAAELRTLVREIDEREWEIQISREGREPEDAA